jgi:hypothetical protein
MRCYRTSLWACSHQLTISAYQRRPDFNIADFNIANGGNLMGIPEVQESTLFSSDGFRSSVFPTTCLLVLLRFAHRSRRNYAAQRI